MGGLIEHKKQRTRRQIGEAALRLFLERGFDQVGVAEIAEAAEVSAKTVYNYFPTKAHLVFDDDQAVLDALVTAVRSRKPRVGADRGPRHAGQPRRPHGRSPAAASAGRASPHGHLQPEPTLPPAGDRGPL